MTKSSDFFDKALAISLGLFILSAGFRGGNTPLVLDLGMVLAAGVFLCVAGYTAFGLSQATRSVPFKLVVAALLLIIVAGAISSLPVSAATWLELPGRAIYGSVLQTLSSAPLSLSTFSLSLDLPGTFLALTVALPCIAVAVCSNMVSEQRLRFLLGAFCVLAIGEALLGLLQLALGSPSFLAFGEAIGGQRAAGTFVNKNHYATLLAMALPLLVMRSAGRIQFGASAQTSFVRDFWWSIATAVVIAALVSSVSRAGTSAGALAAAIALVACFIGRTTSKTRLVVALLAVGVMAVVIPTGLGMLLKSVEGDALTQGAEGRALLNRLTFAAAREFFPLGAGLGSYSIAFQRFQTAEAPGFIEHAHNDYLQLLFELGAIGGLVLILLALAAGLTLVRCVRSWRTSGNAASFASACFLGVFAFSFHAWFDFPAHIPSLAWIVTMLAVAATRADMQMDARANPPTDSHRRRKRARSHSVEQTA